MNCSFLKKTTKSSSIHVDGFPRGTASSRTSTLLALACIPLLSFSQEPRSPECNLICEANTSEEQTNICECFVLAKKAKFRNKEHQKLGWPTPGKVIPPMIRAHETEIEQIENYLTVDRIDITAMPDMRFFERRDDGEFILVQPIEVQRRQMAEQLTGGSTDSSSGPDDDAAPKPKFSAEDQQMRARVAEDPSVALAEMARTLQALSDDLIGPGALDGVTEKVLEAAAGSSSAYEQGREGIEGADDLDGLFGDEIVSRFMDGGKLESTIGLFRVNSFTFEKVENLWGEVSFRRKRADKDHETYLFNRFTLVSFEDPEDRLEDDIAWINDYWMKNNTRNLTIKGHELDGIKAEYQDFVNEVGRVCNIYSLELEVEPQVAPPRTRYDELWLCFEGDLRLRPARLLVDKTRYSNGQSEPNLVYVERISTEYRKVGPANLPHRFREAVGKFLKGVFIPDKGKAVDRKRKYLVNQGLPSTEEWTNILSESLNDPFITDSPR